MPRVVSVIPVPNTSGRKNSIQVVNGTKVLLDDGSYLENIQKITLVAEVDEPWRAIIELTPKNQEQIDAILSDLKVVEPKPIVYVESDDEASATPNQATDNQPQTKE